MDFDKDSKAEKKPKKKLTNFFDERPSDEEDDDNNEFPRTAAGDDDDDDDASDIDMEITWQPGLKSKVEEKFQKPPPSKETKKNKEKKRDRSDLINTQLDDEEDAAEDHRESLELLTVDDEIDSKRDFNLRQMIKEHKQSTKAAAKKGKHSKKSAEISAASSESKPNDDSFQLNVDDQRFQAVYSKAAFNIDQSDPHFKSTAGTQRLIDEKLKKRKLGSDKPSSRTEHYEDDIVTKLKRKSAQHNQ